MEPYIIGGLVGFFIGAALQRLVIYLAVYSVPPTICEYCQWKKSNQWRWDRVKLRIKEGRHKR